ncbi:MAG: nitroreductase family protein [Dehalococcoidia bacterium]|nr:nitroreductase family protein [Dehalococcoidia bacterium]
MGSILDVIRTRRSIRKMTEQSIPEETLQAVLEAGRLAPSWKNGQCWRFIVVKDPERRALIARESSRGELMMVAPVVIVGCALPEQSGFLNGQDYYLVDMGIALEHMILEATAQGLATCWIGIFNESIIKESLGIPDHVRVVNMVIMGYPDEERNPRPRLGLEEIAFVDGWPKEGK